LIERKNFFDRRRNFKRTESLLKKKEPELLLSLIQRRRKREIGS